MTSEINPVKLYLRVFIALLVLLFLTVGIAFIPVRNEHARDLLTTIGFTIAGTKALLIILWFMHVKAGTRLTWIFAASGFVWLIIMFGLTLNDYVTRGQLPDKNALLHERPDSLSERHDLAVEPRP